MHVSESLDAFLYTLYVFYMLWYFSFSYMMLHDEMLFYTMFCRVILLLYIIVTSYITLLSSMLSIILQYITISFIYNYIYLFIFTSFRGGFTKRRWNNAYYLERRFQHPRFLGNRCVQCHASPKK